MKEFNCEYCKQLLWDGNIPPKDKMPQNAVYWEEHYPTCRKMPIVDCGKGHKLKKYFLQTDGCNVCQLEMELKRAEKLYCISCGKQSNKNLIDSDYNYNDWQCKDCLTAFREFI